MYLGLLTTGGEELPKRHGYCRTFIGKCPFGMAPPRADDEAFTFINLRSIWIPRATADWPVILGFGIYAEGDSPSTEYTGPMVGPSEGFKIKVGQDASFAPGQLQFSVHKRSLTTWEHQYGQS